MRSQTLWPVSNSLLPCVRVFVCAVSLSLIISGNTGKREEHYCFMQMGFGEDKVKKKNQIEAIFLS